MIIKVFSTIHPHRFNVRWKKQETSVVPVTTDDNAKLCVGMTLTWLKKTLLNGALHSITELGESNSIAIVSSAFNKVAMSRIENEADLLREVFDLLLSQGLSPVHWRFWEGVFEPFLIVSDLSLKEGCHLIFILGTPETGGHMMGTRVQGNETDFFNSDSGLYRFTNSTEFVTSVTSHISRHYHHILITEMPWLVVKVVSGYSSAIPPPAQG